MSNTPLVSIIVAMAENRVIGVDGKLPWRLSSDMAHFKSTTMGKPIIMGRKTFEGLGRALPGRPNIVITRGDAIDVENVYTASGIDAALELGGQLSEELGTEEILVIGGGEIYAQTLLRAHRIYLTKVKIDVEGDVTFPLLDMDLWQETSKTDHVAGENDDADFSIHVLERV